MKRIYVASRGVEDWKERLASQEHWKAGRSAFELAHQWEALTDTRGLPKPVAALFDKHAELLDAQLLMAVPEHKIELLGSGFASQCDLWALLRTEESLISLSVEGKAGEPFGDKVVAGRGANSFAKRQKRLRGLCEVLGLTPMPNFANLSDLRYQLFHSTASAIFRGATFPRDFGGDAGAKLWKASRWRTDRKQ